MVFEEKSGKIPRQGQGAKGHKATEDKVRHSNFPTLAAMPVTPGGSVTRGSPGGSALPAMKVFYPPTKKGPKKKDASKISGINITA